MAVLIAFQGFTAADDKTAAVEDFLRYLYGAMAHDAIWQYASEEQLQDAQMAIERSVMNRIFKLAFYPNQDGDILRDQYAQTPTYFHTVLSCIKYIQELQNNTHLISIVFSFILFQGLATAH